MVSNQMGEAALRAGAAGAPGAAAPANNRAGKIAQLGFLAMLSAREDGCQCRAAQALRQQTDIMFTELLNEGQAMATAAVTAPEAGTEAPPATVDASPPAVDAAAAIE